ncbi:uroporphyrinogen-III synthase [Thalassotalea aquiviva]|uniref:uroporphyrinogen-III synthase n=1 Tax=Thalassotalea aquiviva TaxID=3242415 RepID=UPI00352A1460
MNKNKLNILLTRPLEKSRLLAKALTPIANSIEIWPLLCYQEGAGLSNLNQQLSQQYYDILIFISEPSVRFSRPFLQQNKDHLGCIIAVGDATANALKQTLTNPIIVPSQHTTEGLLELTELNKVKNKKILIVRGNGGREALKQQLIERGAIVTYTEVYERKWLIPQQSVIERWHQAQINCIVVTSNEMLLKLFTICSSSKALKSALWVVASERIAHTGQQLGLKNIINADGANNQAIYNAIHHASSLGNQNLSDGIQL